MHEDFDSCFRAVQAKDPRFDGWFVTGVISTRIYCRPSCPARTPLSRNVRFFPTAAAAQIAGLRACKRCRPDATPGSPLWNSRRDVVGRAMRMICDGVVEREGVRGLARHLAYSPRQLERLLVAETGAGPLALARAQRAQTARTLIETTNLSMADVAYGAGFASVRQFNDTIREVFAETPTRMRARRARGERAALGEGVSLRLALRSPWSPASLFGHLMATSIPGVEEYADGWYRRTMSLPSGPGIVELAPREDHVACRLILEDVSDLAVAVSRCRRLLDLDADPVAAHDVLVADRALARVVRAAPGRRLPGAIDEVEMTVRVILGQQISTSAARTHGARLVAAAGSRLGTPSGTLTHLFPSLDQLVGLDTSTLAMPSARQRCLSAVIDACVRGDLPLSVGADPREVRGALAAMPGVGPWTIEMIALRALGDPDAFPLTDTGVRLGAAVLGLPARALDLADHAARWRPWRSYATQYLWAATDHSVNHWPPKGHPS